LVKELYKNLTEKAKIKEAEYKKYYHNLFASNGITGEFFKLDFNYKSYVSKYFSYLIQKVMYLQIKNSDKLPIFITLTLPSEYHYSKKRFDGLVVQNENFKYDRNVWGIYKSISEGSEKLYKLFRNFYKSLKSDRDTKDFFTELDYFGIMEYHKSLIPHSHFLLYFPLINGSESETLEVIERKWENFLKRNGLNPETNKLLKLEGEKGGSLYVSKYLQKTLKALENDDSLYFYMGWKSLLNRLFYSSRIGISRIHYEKIYYNLPEQLKNEIMERVKDNNTCIMWEIEKLTSVKSKVKDINGELLNYKNKSAENEKIRVIEVKERIEYLDLRAWAENELKKVNIPDKLIDNIINYIELTELRYGEKIKLNDREIFENILNMAYDYLLFKNENERIKEYFSYLIRLNDYYENMLKHYRGYAYKIKELQIFYRDNDNNYNKIYDKSKNEIFTIILENEKD